MKKPYVYGCFNVRECTNDGKLPTHWHVENVSGQGVVVKTEEDAQTFAHGMSMLAMLKDHMPGIFRTLEMLVVVKWPRDDQTPAQYKKQPSDD